MIKTRYILLFLLSVAGCSHAIVLEPQANWTQKDIVFDFYSTRIPNTNNWYMYNKDEELQSLMLVSPKDEGIDVRFVQINGDQQGIIFEKKGGITRPPDYAYFKSWVELFYSPIPPELNSLSDQEISSYYLESDVNYYKSQNMIKPDANYQLFGLEKEGLERDFRYIDILLNNEFPHLRVACSTFQKNGLKYVLVGKLWTREPSLTEEKEFFGELLFNIH